MADIFLSYAREDRELVRPLQASLAARGFDIFWDTEIQPGIRWDEELQQRLEDAKCVLVAWSEASGRSHWVKDEASYGRDHGILLPVTLDNTPPPLGFRQIQTVDLSGWRGNSDDPALGQLIAQVERLLGSEQKETVGPTVRTTAPYQPSRRRRDILAGGALALMIIGTMLAFFIEPLRGLVAGLTARDTVPVRQKQQPGLAEAEALPAAATRFKECAECPTMVVIPAGQSMVGAPADAIRAGEAASDQGPQHRIVIAAPFAASEGEVTVGGFRAFVEETGYRIEPGCTIFEDGFKLSADASFRRPGYQPQDDFPVVCVSFDDAEAYAAWLSETTGAAYRLLSEAEWEYAARAGSEATYAFGDDSKEICSYANIADLSAKELHPGWQVAECRDGFAGIAPTGSLQANAFGIADMHGNVWEWVADCWHGSFDLAPIDGSAWIDDGDCERRVVRGGSWDVGPRDARVSLRGKLPRDTRHAFYGFRVARF